MRFTAAVHHSHCGSGSIMVKTGVWMRRLCDYLIGVLEAGSAADSQAELALRQQVHPPAAEGTTRSASSGLVSTTDPGVPEGDGT